jgi:ABC-2 type transport system ATP-binding protein
VGVDPQSRVRLLELTRELARGGATVLYTTHYMEEAESLCDRVVIIDHGRILAQGTLPELRSLLGERDLVRFSGVFQPELVRQVFRGDDIDIVQAEENVVTLALHDASGRLPAIFATMGSAHAEIRGTRLSQPSLESLFIKLTGKELRE